MPIFILEDDLSFPPVHLAEPDGLLAIGGDLTKDRILTAYKLGIFPWYEGDHILWWSPDPRTVLFPNELKVSKSMKQILKQEIFQFTINNSFASVISECRNMKRRDQEGTWITDAVEKAYIELHKSGWAHSAETWQGNELIGGLYGIKIGKVFFGESMFSKKANASKFAFIKLVETLRSEGIELIDCQVHTQHLESLGARSIPRNEFIDLVKKYTET